jgi:hypothetical protein
MITDSWYDVQWPAVGMMAEGNEHPSAEDVKNRRGLLERCQAGTSLWGMLVCSWRLSDD